MADSNTTTYSFTLPEVGASADSWGTKLNANWDKVDDLLDGSIAVNGITVTGGSIDGTPVGATTPSTGAFTTLTTTGNVDVTGTVTTDGLTVDGPSDLKGNVSFYEDTGMFTKMLWDAGTERLGIGTEFPTEKIDFGGIGWLKVGRGASRSGGLLFPFSTISNNSRSWAIRNDVSAYGDFSILQSKTNTGDLTVSGNEAARLNIGPTGDVSFYEDTGTTAKMVWDASAESLGIGTSSPSAPLHVHNSATPTTSLSEGLTLSSNVAGVDNRLPAITWDYGITGTPSFAAIDVSRAANTGGNLLFHTSNDSGNLVARMRIDSSGNLLVGTTDNDTVGIVNTTDDAKFKVHGSVGHVAIGRTGNELIFSRGSSNYITANQTGANLGFSINTYAYFNRTDGNDGEIVEFRKDGSTVGSIGSRASVASYFVLDPRTGGSGITGSLDAILPTNNAGVPSDGANSIGSSSHRFKDLYLSGGVYLGGTGAANKLDDYESGTFTPTVTGSTTAGSYSSVFVSSGNYTKIGRKVTASFVFYGTGGTGSGNMVLGGFPFSIDFSENSGTVFANSGVPFTSGRTNSCIVSSSTTFQVREMNPTGGGHSVIAYPTAPTYLRTTVTYFTND